MLYICCRTSFEIQWIVTWTKNWVEAHPPGRQFSWKACVRSLNDDTVAARQFLPEHIRSDYLHEGIDQPCMHLFIQSSVMFINIMSIIPSWSLSALESEDSRIPRKCIITLRAERIVSFCVALLVVVALLIIASLLYSFIVFLLFIFYFIIIDFYFLIMTSSSTYLHHIIIIVVEKVELL